MSLAAIGQFLDVDYVTVAAILRRPRVARFLLALESTMLDGINKDTVKNLNDAIEQTTHEAFQIEVDVMRRLHKREYDVRAQLGAAATAQDILDRAGKRAPAQTRVSVDYSIDTHAIRAAVDAIREHRAIDVTPGRSNGVQKLYPEGDQEAWAAPQGFGGAPGPEDPSEEAGERGETER